MSFFTIDDQDDDEGQFVRSHSINKRMDIFHHARNATTRMPSGHPPLETYGGGVSVKGFDEKKEGVLMMAVHEDI